MVNRLRVLVKWFVEPWKMYILILFFVYIMWCAFKPPIFEKTVCRSGLVLQVAGVFIALVQIQLLKKYYNVKRTFSVFLDWFWRFPERKRNKLVIEEQCNDGFGVIPALQGDGWAIVDAEIQDRLWCLETEMAALRELFVESKEILLQKYKCIDEAVLEEQRHRRDEIANLENKVKETTVGSVYLSEVSLLYIVIGSVMSTVPDLVIRFLF